MQSPASTWFPRLPRRNVRLATLLLGLVVILAACGGDTTRDSGERDEDRRFVTEQRPTHEPSAPPIASPRAQTEPPPPPPTVSPQHVLVARGAPRFVYLLIDARLTAYDGDLRVFTPVAVPEGVQVHDFSPSPTGDRVGVLGVQDQRVTVQFFGADGQPLGEAIVLAVVAPEVPSASPVASAQASPQATPTLTVPWILNIDWVPQGNAVLISGPGVLQRVSMDGSAMPVSRTGTSGTVVNGIWSPMDSQVVLQTQLVDGHHSVFVMDNGHDEANEITILHDSSGSSVTNLQWLPSGLGLMMVAGNLDNGDLMNGQLYVYRFGDQVPVLIATSGQGGPAATITHAVVSPDGNSVAYAIMVRDLDTWYLHSLWVRPLKGGPAISVPVESDSPIITLLWSTEGLIWQQADGSTSVVDGQLRPRPLGDAPAATPVASPVASPIATPVQLATPRG